MPILCAASWTWNHSSGRSFPGAIRSRTRSEKISAPPPGIESRPASFSVRRTSSWEQVVALHERDAVVEVEPLAGEDLLLDRCERVEPVQNRHVPLFLLFMPVDDCVRQGLELLAVKLSVEARPGLSSVVESHLPGL